MEMKCIMNDLDFYSLFANVEKTMSAVGHYDTEVIKKAYDELYFSSKNILEKANISLAYCLTDTVDATEMSNELEKMQQKLLHYCLESVNELPNGLYKYINEGIILDFLHDDEHLWITLDRLYHVFTGNGIDDTKVLWECGNLCYKLNRYSEVIEYLKCYINRIKDNDVWRNNIHLNNDIARACVKIGYCYEFENDFFKALYIYDKIKNSHNIEEVDVSFVKSIESYLEIAIDYADLEDDIKKDIDHGFGHFYNELVLFSKDKEISKINDKMKAIFLQSGNRIMYDISCERSNYLSCLGTNHSEYSEFNEAIDILNFAIENGAFNWPGTQIPNDHLINRVEFYKGHAYMYCGMFKEAQECFDKIKIYCIKHKDNDGYAHLAIYQAFLVLLENGLSEVNGQQIVEHLEELKRYKPSLYSNIQMIDEREMLIHLLNALIFVNILMFKDEPGDFINAYYERGYVGDIIRDLAIELVETLKSMEKIVGRKLFDNIPYCQETKESLYKLVNYYGKNLLCVGNCPGNVDGFKVISETDFFNFLGNYPLLLNTEPQVSVVKKLKNKLTDHHTVIVSNNYMDFAMNNLSNVSCIFCETKDMLNYGCIVATYGLICKELLAQRPFLGMSPTKITQIYVYRPRQYKGLFKTITFSFDARCADGFDDLINCCNIQYNNFLQGSCEANHPKQHYDFMKIVDHHIVNSSYKNKISGVIYQPKYITNNDENKCVWLYKFYDSLVLLDNDKDKIGFYKRYRNCIRTKRPYSNMNYGFPNTTKKLKKVSVHRCKDCKKNVRKVYAEYFSFENNSADWLNIQRFILEDLLNNMLFVKTSVNNIKQFMCFKLMPITADISGYIYIICSELMDTHEEEVLQAELLKIFCHEYFQCDMTEEIMVEKETGETSEPDLQSGIVSDIEQRTVKDTIINGLNDLVGK